ncbi:LPS export ABC transporter permease LptF [Sphingorhabdus lutea]|uniref:LPS export ABC transporter permease LptF n=2 Tax=Sphingorhabdus lutea TaxID=1913578 RepID=A0A1L3JAG4_9SPHN|nr:LPS export ABC transporter permease LptF [Sphingorhabdus lutea]
MLATLTIAAMLLLLDKMLRLFDFVASEGGPVSVVWRMLANLLPEYLSLGIPIGVLMGILLAFRKLALSSELDIFRAVGQGYWRLLRVPYMIAILLMGVNLAIVGYVQPVSRYLYEELQFDLRSGALGASIKVGEFNNLGKNITIRIEDSKDNGTNLSGIFVHMQTKSGQSLSASADKGMFLRTDDRDTIIFRMKNGTLVHDSPKYVSPRILTFSNHDIPIDLPALEKFRGRGGGDGGKDRENTLPELWKIGGDMTKSADVRNAARANMHFRIVEVVMMLLLPLLALALAIPPKRSTSALGVFLSIIMVVTYHKINEYGASVGSMGIVDPIIALWGPFIIFAGLILWMYHIIAHVPGGQPIGYLEVMASKFGKWLKKLLPSGGSSANRHQPDREGA